MSLPPPSELGLPDQFSKWYPGQEQAMEWILARLFEPTPRFLALSAPTGSGKSLLAVLSAVLSGQRSVILTATKALQGQYISQLGGGGVVLPPDPSSLVDLADLRGTGSYRCQMDHSVTADIAPCRVGVQCSAAYCPHKSALGAAIRASQVLTNYACWMYNSDKLSDPEKNPVGLLVLDEAHKAHSQLSEFQAIEFQASVIEEYGLQVPDPATSIEAWKAWAKLALPGMESLVKALALELKIRKSSSQSEVKKLVRMKSFLSKLEAACGISGNWVVGSYTPPWKLHQRGDRTIYKLCPVWPKQYAESSLFCGVPKVLLMSATLTPKTLDLLGLVPSDYDFLELPSSFPVENRLVIHVPTAKMSRQPSIEARLAWVSRIDQIIDARLDRKGLIHTTSYDRRTFLMQNSRFREIMISHDKENVQEQIARFKRSPAPAVMVSPSMAEGVDYPGEECRYVVIGKVPFLDTRDPLTAARASGDKEWANHETMQAVVQAAGRGNRKATDVCEIFIVDNDWTWYYRHNQPHAPAYFREAVRFEDLLPQPKD